MARVAILGGGLTGLSAAYRLSQLRPDLEIEVFEPSNRVGGNIATSPIAGIQVDEAADAFLVRVDAAVDLCTELGLESELVHPSGLAAGLWSDGEVRELPSPHVLGVPLDPESLAQSPLVGPEAVSHLQADIAGASPRLDDYGDSVGTLLRTRLGDEITDRVIEPLLNGVYAAPVNELSLSAVTPQFAVAANAESFTRALSARIPAAKPGQQRAPIFAAPRGGMGTLITSLAERLNGKIKFGLSASGLTVTSTGVDISFQDHSGQFDGVIVATPGHVSADLLSDFTHASAFGSDPVSVTFITLALDPDSVGVSLDRSGFLVPAHEGKLVTACSFTTSKWPHLQSDVPIVRAAVGRANDDQIAKATDSEILDAVTTDLTEMLELSAPPLEARISRWPNSFPRYRPGHLDRMAKLTEELSSTPVFVAGAAVSGVGIPACINSADVAARRLAGKL